MIREVAVIRKSAAEYVIAYNGHESSQRFFSRGAACDRARTEANSLDLRALYIDRANHIREAI
jgi:hypothetical protein